MRRHWRFLIKIVCFTVIAALAFHTICAVLTPKYLYDNIWPTTQTFTDFYQLERDSVDVLFFGSSHCVSAFSPLGLYESYGISSYNLGSEQQDLLISYYWLKEALRFQSPQVVVLETYLLFPYRAYEGLNSEESTQRKAIDYMKWSPVKQEAIAAICENDESQSAISYYLTNIRFHTRWTDLNQDDFTFGIVPSQAGLMGYSALEGSYGNTDYAPFQSDSSVENEQPVSLMKEYLDRIVSLCEEHEITLIFVKTPTVTDNVGKCNFVTQYAAEHGIQFIDFNEETAYREAGIDFASDIYDDEDHLNVQGAQKVTAYLGNILVSQYDVPARTSEEHENLLPYYDEIMEGFE